VLRPGDAADPAPALGALLGGEPVLGHDVADPEAAAGALSEGEYRRHLDAAGFADVDIALTHEVADGLHGAIVRAVKPEASPAA